MAPTIFLGFTLLLFVAETLLEEGIARFITGLALFATLFCWVVSIFLVLGESGRLGILAGFLIGWGMRSQYARSLKTLGFLQDKNIPLLLEKTDADSNMSAQ
jgi:hypothetical protein